MKNYNNHITYQVIFCRKSQNKNLQHLNKKGAARIEDRLKIFLSGARRLSDRREDWRSAVGGWRGMKSAFFPAANALGNMSREEADTPFGNRETCEKFARRGRWTPRARNRDIS